MSFSSSFFLKTNKRLSVENIGLYLYENGNLVEKNAEIKSLDSYHFHITLLFEKEGDYNIVVKALEEIIAVKILRIRKDYLQELHKQSFGNWEIKDNKMYFYDTEDNILAVFELYDKNGVPTEVGVMKRKRVE